MRPCEINCINVSRYAPGHNDPRRAGKWFWELIGSDGTSWSMCKPLKQLKRVVMDAETFRCFSGLPLRSSQPEALVLIGQFKRKVVAS